MCIRVIITVASNAQAIRYLVMTDYLLYWTSFKIYHIDIKYHKNTIWGKRNNPYVWLIVAQWHHMNIGSGNDLLPDQHHAITSILRTNLNEIESKYNNFHLWI